MTGSNLYLNYVNGQWVPASTGNVSQSVNPADLDDVIGDFQASNAVDAEGAVGAAADSARVWGSMSALARGGLLLVAADYLNQNSERYAQAITRECGKAIMSRLEVRWDAPSLCCNILVSKGRTLWET